MEDRFYVVKIQESVDYISFGVVDSFRDIVIIVDKNFNYIQYLCDILNSKKNYFSNYIES